MTSVLTSLAQALQPHGLMTLGHCLTVPQDQLGNGTIVLIGPEEPFFWDVFTNGPEYKDEQSDPLDRWSKRVLSDVAATQKATALFPFGGAPFLPFFTWAERSGRFWSSPIGFLVHDTAGLFVSFRGALLLSEPIAAQPGRQPCKTCDTKPCAAACPVDAFSDGYDVAACKTHISTPAGKDCLHNGCQARQACPVGHGNRRPEQAHFHMKAFL